MTISIRAMSKPAVLIVAVLASGVMFGCGAEGEGTIKISDPAKLRAQAGGGGGASTGKTSPKQAKAKALEEEAAKKHPKLQ